MGDANHVKLSPFNDADVRSWLNLVDLQLDAVAQPKSKYARLVSVLPTSISSQVTDVTNRHISASRDADAAVVAHGNAPNPPAAFNWAAAYAELKSELLSRYSANDEAAIRNLLAEQELGDLRPSQFLRKLQGKVAGRHIECAAFIKEKFLKALPTNIRGPLVCLSSPSLDELAAAADRMYDNAVVATTSVNAVTRSTDAKHAAADADVGQPPPGFWQRMEASMAAMATRQATDQATIAALNAKIDKIEKERGRSRGRSRGGRGTSRSRDASTPEWEATEDTCYFHVRFGGSAMKCGKTKNGTRCKFNSTGGATVNNIAYEQSKRDRLLDKLLDRAVSKLNLSDSEN